ncbi:MAG: FGGY-family carbohydrate kinase [Firmicutes bacterium]|nr:FGGY-family carbohydrate kinase [Bacillota bacterium]
MYVIVYDFGTSAVKTCLFEVDASAKLIGHDSEAYGLYFLENGGAEQDTEEWWSAIARSTKKLMTKTGVDPSRVEGIIFCAQMQGVVLVDEKGNALRPAMNYLDQRGRKEFEDCMGKGLIKISGCSLFKLARNLRVNYAGSVSVKDPVWKYKWVERNEPEIFEKVYKWLDVNDYLIARCTGRIVRTADSAFATFLYDTRKGKEGWNKSLVKMYGVRWSHLPEIIDSTEVIGGLTGKAAEELGLKEGTPVFGGGGDTSFMNMGAGCTKPGDTHIYVGTSGWVSTFMDRQTVDLNAMITGVLSAKRGYFNYYAELETAGKCFEWVRDHLALDEVGIYLESQKVDPGVEEESLYDYLSDEVSKVPPGANGVIFTPWLHGNRCPFEDSRAAGMFFNIKVDNGKRDLIRAVLEGICYHLRWLLESVEAKVKTYEAIRFVGGLAMSHVTCQMLADITGRKVETVENPLEACAAGAALVVAAGLKNVDVLDLARKDIKANCTYIPNPDNKKIYDRNYQVFKRLYKSNKKNFRDLNR